MSDKLETAGKVILGILLFPFVVAIYLFAGAGIIAMFAGTALWFLRTVIALLPLIILGLAIVGLLYIVSRLRGSSTGENAERDDQPAERD